MNKYIEFDFYGKWFDIHVIEPELKDSSVLMCFANGSVETVHIEDFFRPITNGFNDKGEQQYTKLWIEHDPPCTHWMELPNPPQDREMSKQWVAVDFGECPLCGDSAEILTDCKIEGQFYDSDQVRCVTCHHGGCTYVDDEANLHIIWDGQ